MPLGPVGSRLVAVGAIARRSLLVHIVGVRSGTRLLTIVTVLKTGARRRARLRSVREHRRRSGSTSCRSSRGVPGRRRLRAQSPARSWRRSSHLAGGGRSRRSPARCAIRVRTHAARAAAAAWLGGDAGLCHGHARLHVRHAHRAGRRPGGVRRAGRHRAARDRRRRGVAGIVVVVRARQPRSHADARAAACTSPWREDGLFPAAAAAVHPRFGTPARAIAIQALLASALVAARHLRQRSSRISSSSPSPSSALTVGGGVRAAPARSGVSGARPPLDAAVVVPVHGWRCCSTLLVLNNPLQALLGVCDRGRSALPVYHAW